MSLCEARGMTQAEVDRLWVDGVRPGARQRGRHQVCRGRAAAAPGAERGGDRRAAGEVSRPSPLRAVAVSWDVR